MSIMPAKEIRLIINDYKRKTNNKNVNLSFRGVNEKGELVFSVFEHGKYLTDYKLAKMDLSSYNEHPYLTIPDKVKDSLLVNDKRYIVNWINKKVNIDILEEDISLLILRNKKLTIVTNPSSNRFYNNFNIIIN